jgi:RimJ/RimL family protein N-acetyltransferase
MGENLLQPQLSNDIVTLRPLHWDDFEILYSVASDPLIWEQHPNPNRYQRPVFENYFKGAMESGGAFLITEAATGDVIGSSRFYDHEPDNSVLKIGYTFFARSSWGKGHNRASKMLMMQYAFGFVDNIIFHVGEDNMRSRIAMTRLGAELAGMEKVAYYGEPDRMNCVFVMRRIDLITSSA